MADPLFLCTLLWFAISIAVLATLRRREQRAIQAQVRQIGQLANETNELILFLDYSAPGFKEIDAFLLTDMPSRVTVVFHAPEWLIAAKSKRWERHCVVSAGSLNASSSGVSPTRIILDKGGKYRVFHEVPAFLKLMSRSKT
ncbi:hypothetical protein QJ48_03580 [Paenibacillus sp. A3]|uniref:hypothetical protein n=1 Tax=Paenibacillus sp. A3 TaxID=1337054 RepID=UPI0006D574E7|nr:hypothetical protein [Paenibacillus sp. A3]KPV60794.1 hypothetical protein QJ48_03580 [Paenibacillus sp. A3]